MDTINICCCCINNRKISNPTEKTNTSSSKKRHKNYDIYNGEKVRYSKIQFSEDNDSSILNSKRWEFVHTEECIICMKPTIIIGGIITCIDCKEILKVPKNHSGNIRCPICKNMMTVDE